MSKGPFYFGCNTGAGHYAYEPGMHNAERKHNCQWLICLDGVLAPEGPQVEGVARLHHFNGMTLLAFWDRSVDSRPGSNSIFVLPNPRLTFERAVAAAKVAFPEVWARFKCDVVPEPSP